MQVLRKDDVWDVPVLYFNRGFSITSSASSIQQQSVKRVRLDAEVRPVLPSLSYLFVICACRII
jgi:hypothetical protein